MSSRAPAARGTWDRSRKKRVEYLSTTPHRVLDACIAALFIRDRLPSLIDFGTSSFDVRAGKKKGTSVDQRDIVSFFFTPKIWLLYLFNYYICILFNNNIILYLSIIYIIFINIIILINNKCYYLIIILYYIYILFNNILYYTIIILINYTIIFINITI